ncbi:PLP-dependent aminotransferase family protein [uncultured Acetatifactor sp.]|uniref:MocR-like pyridoxine biosynthesis transcription factor PdxR n=1 Tax=uncultured Acetatifactor sp. TaxID=1671927 RepID=UPI0026317A95|nr:PLP-dependent aminotransferase family protein [uncultured Acetatifactor sp.]
MTFQIRTEGDSCLYEQIYGHIKGEIRSGKLLSGERLPSTRSLAEYLQVARSTVDCAYGQLLSEGYIESRPYKGYFVCPIEELLQLDSGLSALENRQAAVGAMPGGREEPYRIDFSPYDIDMSGFPFSVWKKITKNILTDANSDLFAKGEGQGDYSLRQTISRYLHSARGVECRPEQIIVGAGNDFLLLLLEKILGRDVRIAMENPTYKRSYRIFRSFAYPIVTVDMDECGMRADRLEQADVRAAYVMPSHQFPMGTVMPIGRRMELLKWADGGSDRYLIEDDYDSEFRFRGKPIPALQASDRHGRVIYMGSFSKAIAPAIRVSFMVLPKPLLEIYERECSFYSCTVSRIDQSILNVFIGEGYFERHLNKMRKIYRGKHELLLECLGELREEFAIAGENAGLHLLLTSKRGIPEGELLERAAGRQVRVYGLSESSVEEASGGAAVLLGFGGLTDEEIREGTALLKEAWL